MQVLRQGGNAADAAAVVQFVLSVVQPQSMGIGGGCLLLYYDALNDTVHALDGREEAPEAFNGRQFCINNDCITNPLCDCSSGTVPIAQRYTGGEQKAFFFIFSSFHLFLFSFLILLKVVILLEYQGLSMPRIASLRILGP